MRKAQRQLRRNVSLSNKKRVKKYMGKLRASTKKGWKGSAQNHELKIYEIVTNL